MCYHTQRRAALAEQEHDTVVPEESDEREAIERDEIDEEHSPESEDADRRIEPIGLA
jgi:hypothetical protein